MQLLKLSLRNAAAYGIEMRFRFIPSPIILASCSSVGMLLGVAGGLLPALRASRIDPLRALRG